MMWSNTHCYELNVRSCPLLEEDRTAASTQRLTGGGRGRALRARFRVRVLWFWFRHLINRNLTFTAHWGQEKAEEWDSRVG